MDFPRPRRSVLYVPASHSRAMDNAARLGVDAIIVDLEDAVAPEMKEGARQRACDAVRRRVFGASEVIVRVNAADTPWGAQDLVCAMEAGPDAILMPKVRSAEDVLQACREMNRLGAASATQLWAMVESADALLRIREIAAAAKAQASRLVCLVLGLNDLARETQAHFVPGRAPMLNWLSAAVLAARANGLCVLDGVYNALEDVDGLRAECQQARDFGFDGKTLIHPGQVQVAHQAFAPSEADVAHARAVVAAFDNPLHAGRGAVRVEGVMVERLHLHAAHRTLARAAWK